MTLRSARMVSLATVITASIFQIKNAAADDSANYRTTPGFADLHLKVNDAFTQARARLVKFGWVPTRMHQQDNYEYDGAEKELADRGFLEVDFCSTDVGALCVLYYSKAGKCLRLNTKGEQIRFMRNTSWQNECSLKKG